MAFQSYFSSGSSNIEDIYDWKGSEEFYEEFGSFLNKPEETTSSIKIGDFLNLPKFIGNPITYNPNVPKYSSYNAIDIEDLFKQEGITHVNGKKIHFGSREIRKGGNPNSHHKTKNPHTGFANARDVSIVNGEIEDYESLKDMLLNNLNIVNWMSANNWGIINELTPEVLSKTKGTGLHFHFGPDRWAVRTWNAWLNNPDLPVTQMV